jgi:hypothetical protein
MIKNYRHQEKHCYTHCDKLANSKNTLFPTTTVVFASNTKTANPHLDERKKS